MVEMEAGANEAAKEVEAEKVVDPTVRTTTAEPAASIAMTEIEASNTGIDSVLEKEVENLIAEALNEATENEEPVAHAATKAAKTMDLNEQDKKGLKNIIVGLAHNPSKFPDFTASMYLTLSLTNLQNLFRKYFRLRLIHFRAFVSSWMTRETVKTNHGVIKKRR